MPETTGNGKDEVALLQQKVADLEARLRYYEPIEQALSHPAEWRTMIVSGVDVNGKPQSWVMGKIGPMELIGLADTTPEAVKDALFQQQPAAVEKPRQAIVSPFAGRG